MKIARRRKAISQSMDLFIIIAAVLGVGGVVTASIYNLVNSATSNSSVAVVGASLVAGADSTKAPSAMSITIKNDGGSTIDCGTGSCEVVVVGTNITGTPTQCQACIVSSPTGWNVSTHAGSPLTFVFSPANKTLAPGAQASLLVSGPAFTGAYTLTGMPTRGSTVTLNVIFGSASTQVTVVAQ